MPSVWGLGFVVVFGLLLPGLAVAGPADVLTADVVGAYYPLGGVAGVHADGVTLRGAVVTVHWLVVDSPALRTRVEVHRDVVEVLVSGASFDAVGVSGPVAIYGGEWSQPRVDDAWVAQARGHWGAVDVVEPLGGDWATPHMGVDVDSPHWVGVSAGGSQMFANSSVKLFGARVEIVGEGRGAGSYLTGSTQVGNVVEEMWVFVEVGGVVEVVSPVGVPVYASQLVRAPHHVGVAGRALVPAGGGLALFGFFVVALACVVVVLFAVELRRFRVFVARFASGPRARLLYAELLAAQGRTFLAAWHLTVALRLEPALCREVDVEGCLRDAIKLLSMPARMQVAMTR